MPVIRVVLIALLLSACSSLPSDQEVDEANYGSAPSEYELIVKAYYQMTVNEPGTTKYNAIHKPVRYWLANKMGDTYYGYLVCATVNTKNLLGKYSGFRHDALLIHNDHVVKYVKGGDWWGEQLCPNPSSNAQ
ncbi:hypothetical protein [Alteromonas halophila]|uniref:Uncharacterized protein n=1 Tax=Alteromonas halophila TaxID=516698 RepID=A0A918MXZ3_9ALTE|nr:hypothetical protein [Alteromonas halophila]GGW83880.1 hypothetical protein GCM10007391_16860 [Alteromonas halophila]